MPTATHTHGKQKDRFAGADASKCRSIGRISSHPIQTHISHTHRPPTQICQWAPYISTHTYRKIAVPLPHTQQSALYGYVAVCLSPVRIIGTAHIHSRHTHNRFRETVSRNFPCARSTHTRVRTLIDTLKRFAQSRQSQAAAVCCVCVCARRLGRKYRGITSLP